MYTIQFILEDAGCTLHDVVKGTVHLFYADDFDRYNALYAKYFDKVKPARTTVQSVLGHGIKIEIDAIARLSS